MKIDLYDFYPFTTTSLTQHPHLLSRSRGVSDFPSNHPSPLPPPGAGLSKTPDLHLLLYRLLALLHPDPHSRCWGPQTCGDLAIPPSSWRISSTCHVTAGGDVAKPSATTQQGSLLLLPYGLSEFGECSSGLCAQPPSAVKGELIISTEPSYLDY